MEQIFERREQTSQYLQPYMEECFQKSCNLIQTELDYHASEIWDELKCSINECLQHAAIMQQRQSKGKLQYLVFSFLHCGIYFDRLELRIDFLDDNFYLDEQETATYYYPVFLQEKYIEDISFLQKKAGEKFVRLQNYERIDTKKEYSDFYQSFKISIQIVFCLLLRLTANQVKVFFYSENCEKQVNMQVSLISSNYICFHPWYKVFYISNEKCTLRCRYCLS